MHMDTVTISAELQCAVESAKERTTYKYITLKSAAKYFCAVVNKVTVYKEAHDNQRKNSRTGFINVSIISNNRSTQSDPRLAWIMFYKIAHMYRDISKQETEQASLLFKASISNSSQPRLQIHHLQYLLSLCHFNQQRLLTQKL